MNSSIVHPVLVNALQDNYCYLVHDPVAKKTAVVDPSEATPVLVALRQNGWKLDYVWNTHHHWDHVGGNGELKKETGCQIIGSRYDAHRIPALDKALGEGEDCLLGNLTAKILEIPGHTLGHIAYWISEIQALFCGDTLFSLGCGRLFEGTPAQMWASLSKLAALPDDTRVYCGHEYTVANASFALTLDPDNEELKARAEEAKALRKAGRPTIPSLLGQEKRINPFLRPSAESIRRTLGLETSGPVKVFTEVRRRKDNFT